MTAGQWPSHRAKNASAHEWQLSSNLRVTNRTWQHAKMGARVAIESGPRDFPLDDEPAPSGRAPGTRATDGYAAQIVKSTDGGETWTSLFTDTGNFYFNEIDCFDGEGPPPACLESMPRRARTHTCTHAQSRRERLR